MKQSRPEVPLTFDQLAKPGVRNNIANVEFRNEAKAWDDKPSWVVFLHVDRPLGHGRATTVYYLCTQRSTNARRFKTLATAVKVMNDHGVTTTSLWTKV